MRFTSPCGNTEEQEIAKGIFLQTNVKSVPFSTLTLSVLMVIFILSEFVDFLLLKVAQQVYEKGKDLRLLTQELLAMLIIQENLAATKITQSLNWFSGNFHNRTMHYTGMNELKTRF